MPKYSTWKIDDEVDLRMGEGLAAHEPQTVIQVFQETVAKFGSANALHVKRDGEWQTLTFQEYYDTCTQFGKALLHIGMERFDAVSIIGFNSVEWLAAMIGTIMAGGVAAGVYTTNQPHACEHIARHSGSIVAVCDGIKQLEKFLAIQKNLPKLKALVLYNAEVPEGLQSDIPVYTFDKFMELGKDVDDAKLTERIEMQKPGHCCSLIYTSGTTGAPKGVMISHDNLHFAVLGLVTMVNRQFNTFVDNKDSMISFLPLSHIAAQVVDVMVPIKLGVQLWFAQPDALKGSLGTTLKEVRPTIMVAVPRVWEKMVEKMQSIMSKATGVKKHIAVWAMKKGLQKSMMAQYGKSGGVPCGFGAAHALVLGRIKEAMGLDKCFYCVTAAAPISREVLEFFGSLDIPINDLFGQSEATGPQTLNIKGFWRMGTAGITMDGCNTRAVPGTQELIFSGRNIMMGYLNAEQQTKETIDEEGWLHSGDCGNVDEDGFMTVTGRIKELLITAGGENIPPVLIEDELKKQIPIVSNAVLIGDKRKFLTCLLTLRVKVDQHGQPTDELDRMAQEVLASIGSTAKTVAEAKECDKVKEYITEGVKRANAQATSRAQNVGKFEILDTDFSIAGGEMTPTLKVKRNFVLEKYADVIEKMYQA